MIVFRQGDMNRVRYLAHIENKVEPMNLNLCQFLVTKRFEYLPYFCVVKGNCDAIFSMIVLYFVCP